MDVKHRVDFAQITGLSDCLQKVVGGFLRNLGKKERRYSSA